MKRSATAVGLAALGIGLAALPVSSTSQGDGEEVVTPASSILNGLKAFSVAVDVPDRNAQEDGLKEGLIQTDVELKLRQSGIRVVSKKEAALLPGSPYLYINVNTMKSKAGPQYAFSILMEFKESVLLERNPKVEVTGATVWRTGAVGLVRAADLGQYTRDHIKDYVDQFCNDYLKANPR